MNTFNNIFIEINIKIIFIMLLAINIFLKLLVQVYLYFSNKIDIYIYKDDYDNKNNILKRMSRNL